MVIHYFPYFIIIVFPFKYVHALHWVLIWWAIKTGTQRGSGWKAIHGGYKEEWCNWEQSFYVKQPTHFQKKKEKRRTETLLCTVLSWGKASKQHQYLTRDKQALKLNRELQRKHILWLFNPSFQQQKRPRSMLRCL